MQRIIRADGSIVEPPPLRLGQFVGDELVTQMRNIMAPLLLEEEFLLAVVCLISEEPWEMFFVLSEHHYSRVAFTAERSEARILTVAHEHTLGGILNLSLRGGETVLMGQGLHANDGDIVYECVRLVRNPAGSDGKHVFVESESVRSASWSGEVPTRIEAE